MAWLYWNLTPNILLLTPLPPIAADCRIGGKRQDPVVLGIATNSEAAADHQPVELNRLASFAFYRHGR